VRGGAIAPADGAAAITLFKSDFQNEYQVIEVTEPLIDRAVTLAEKHALRGYDAVQLAAAVELHILLTTSGLPPLTFVVADAALLVSATAEGLTAADPNNHP
jgi:hypothetical protein